MKAARARSLALEDLPDDLIARVVELGGREAWPVLALVSRRFHGLLYSPAVPEAWRSFNMRPGLAGNTTGDGWQQRLGQRLPGWRAHKLGLLKSVGGAVQSLTVSDALPGELALGIRPRELLAPLRPGTLHYLEWQTSNEPLPPALLEALLRLACGLTSLLLFSQPALPAELPAALQACSRLETLSLYGPLQELPPLTALRRLRHLHLSINLDCPVDSRLVLPPRSELAPCLEELALRAIEGGACFEVGGATVYQAHCWYPSDGIHGQQVEQLWLGEGEQGGGPAGVLAAALDGLLLPGGPPLVLLELDHLELPAWRLACGSRLAQLAYLYMDGCYGEGGVEDALEVLLPQTPWLLELHLEHCYLEWFDGWPPPAVVGHAGLRSLSLVDCSLQRLPPGPYMRDLRSLDISEEDEIEGLASLRQALAQAQRLERLKAGKRFAEGLAPADVDWLLDACPHLRDVDIEFSPAFLSPREPTPSCQAVLARLQAALEARRAAAPAPAGPPAAESDKAH